jgi:hypothetical protein
MRSLHGPASAVVAVVLVISAFPAPVQAKDPVAPTPTSQPTPSVTTGPNAANNGRARTARVSRSGPAALAAATAASRTDGTRDPSSGGVVVRSPNPTYGLGLNPEGNIDIPQGSDWVGLRKGDQDALSPGCACEGWGIAERPIGRLLPSDHRRLDDQGLRWLERRHSRQLGHPHSPAHSELIDLYRQLDGRGNSLRPSIEFVAPTRYR